MPRTLTEGPARRSGLLALASAVAFAACGTGRPAPSALPAPHGLAQTGYHGGPARLGWNDDEPSLTPEHARSLSLAWASPALDTFDVGGRTFAAHLYASPLYKDDVEITIAPFSGLKTGVAFVATSNGDVYAIDAIDGPRAAGTILWRAHLGDPSQPDRSTDGVPLGILSTPVMDASVTPPRIYVTAADATKGWRAFALDASSGAVLDGWPVELSASAVEGANENRVAGQVVTFADFHALSQRGALALSADGNVLYVPFGSYFDGAVGWMVAIDTLHPGVVASFSGAPADVVAPPGPDANLASAGMWGASGAAVAADGRLFLTTGNSPPDSRDALGVWGNSLLSWRAPLALEATYSPFNYCAMDAGDTDLGGGAPIVFDLDPATTTTPHLVAFGGKQGNAYLADRYALGGRLDRRPPCDPAHPASPSTDRSLFGQETRDYYSPPSPGPLNVFGPYSDAPGANEVNQAKARTTPAFFRDEHGAAFLYYSGNARDPSDPTVLAPPSIARLRVVTRAGAAAELAIDAVNPTVVMKNPGSPVVSSDHGSGAVVWVLDENGLRTDALVPGGANAPPLPVLYAFDATSLELLSRTELPAPGGKYDHPTIAHGLVLVGADRLYALRGP